MRILSVDDSLVVRKIIRGAAETLGIDMLEAEDGYDALKVLEKEEGNIDLILLDWNMPGMNGYELLLELKSDEKYYNIPIMMVTTEGQKESIIAAVKAGASNYMIKPFAIDELAKKILECMGRGSI